MLMWKPREPTLVLKYRRRDENDTMKKQRKARSFQNESSKFLEGRSSPVSSPLEYVSTFTSLHHPSLRLRGRIKYPLLPFCDHGCPLLSKVTVVFFCRSQHSCSNPPANSCQLRNSFSVNTHAINNYSAWWCLTLQNSPTHTLLQGGEGRCDHDSHI